MVIQPGLYGNGIQVGTSTSEITFDSGVTYGGLDNGTTGVVGDLRKGPIYNVDKEGITHYQDAIFECIAPNVWSIISSAKNGIVDNSYNWTNI